MIESILLFFGNHTSIISFLGAIIGGEGALIFLSILASQGFLNQFFLFIFFYLGIICSDMIWFFLGRSKFFDWILTKKHISKAYFIFGKLLSTTMKKNNFQILLVTKFLYGFRLPTIMYLSRKSLNIKSFLVYTLIVNFIWTIVILLIGWYAGKGISVATNISENITLYLILIGFVLLIFIFLIRILGIIIKKWLMKKQKQ